MLKPLEHDTGRNTNFSSKRLDRRLDECVIPPLDSPLAKSQPSGGFSSDGPIPPYPIQIQFASSFYLYLIRTHEAGGNSLILGRSSKCDNSHQNPILLQLPPGHNHPQRTKCPADGDVHRNRGIRRASQRLPCHLLLLLADSTPGTPAPYKAIPSRRGSAGPGRPRSPPHRA